MLFPALLLGLLTETIAPDKDSCSVVVKYKDVYYVAAQVDRSRVSGRLTIKMRDSHPLQEAKFHVDMAKTKERVARCRRSCPATPTPALGEAPSLPPAPWEPDCVRDCVKADIDQEIAKSTPEPTPDPADVIPGRTFELSGYDSITTSKECTCLPLSGSRCVDH
jgi:hypothetical protein